MSIKSDTVELGRALAALLSGAWRAAPPVPELSPSGLAEIIPLLRAGNADALAWWRLRNSALAKARVARPLLETYHSQFLHNQEHQEHLRKTVSLLRAAGIEPILVKGWSVARLYADPGLRPCGDIDLCVRPEQLPEAIEAMKDAGIPLGMVDLHAGVADLDDRTWDAVVSRSRLVRCGDTDIRFLGAEDQLRQVCLHMVRHGAWRPLWLCDVGVLLEAANPKSEARNPKQIQKSKSEIQNEQDAIFDIGASDFDWKYCLSGNRRLTEWVLCAIGLACRLLGARVSDPGVSRRAEKTPEWMLDTVLAAWGEERITEFPPLKTYLRRPWGLWQWARRRLRRNPVEVLFNLRISPDFALPGLALRPIAFLLETQANTARRFAPRPVWRGRPPGVAFDVHPTRRQW